MKPENTVITSPRTARYNCIAWAAGKMDRWWWPSTRAYWPVTCPSSPSVDSFIEAFGTLGYEVCSDGAQRAEQEKVVFYVKEDGQVTHAARQLNSGEWTSKLGRLEDVRHKSPDVLTIPYGFPILFMTRDILDQRGSSGTTFRGFNSKRESNTLKVLKNPSTAVDSQVNNGASRAS